VPTGSPHALVAGDAGDGAGDDDGDGDGDGNDGAGDGGGGDAGGGGDGCAIVTNLQPTQLPDWLVGITQTVSPT
jgi:hypothetical protein